MFESLCTSPRYPSGSIVAHVTVAFDTEVSADSTNAIMIDPEGTAIARTTAPKTVKEHKQVTFTGCISGQTELDWKVADIK